MKITLTELTNCTNALRKLSEKDMGEPILNYRLMNILDVCNAESKKFIDLQKKIIDKYKENTTNDSIIIPTENINAFNKEMLDAGKIEIEIEWTAPKFNINDLAGFTAKDLKNLSGKFIEIEEVDNG